MSSDSDPQAIIDALAAAIDAFNEEDTAFPRVKTRSIRILIGKRS